MSRAIQAGLILVAASTAVWIILLLAFMYAPILEIKFYPRYTAPLAAVFPLFFARPIASFIIKNDGDRLTSKEVIVMTFIAVLGCAASSFTIEAGIIHSALSQAQEISFSEVISEPFSNRYSITVLFGLSFFVSAIIVIAFVSAIRIPATVHLRLRLQNSNNSASVDS